MWCLCILFPAHPIVVLWIGGSELQILVILGDAGLYLAHQCSVAIEGEAGSAGAE